MNETSWVGGGPDESAVSIAETADSEPSVSKRGVPTTGVVESGSKSARSWSARGTRGGLGGGEGLSDARMTLLARAEEGSGCREFGFGDSVHYIRTLKDIVQHVRGVRS